MMENAEDGIETETSQRRDHIRIHTWVIGCKSTRNKKLEESSTCEGLVLCGVLDKGFLVNTQHVISTRPKFHHTSLGKKGQNIYGLGI
jgi:hypothetical protein